jgi:hypothetical protein
MVHLPGLADPGCTGAGPGSPGRPVGRHPHRCSQHRLRVVPSPPPRAPPPFSHLRVLAPVPAHFHLSGWTAAAIMALQGHPRFDPSRLKPGPGPGDLCFSASDATLAGCSDLSSVAACNRLHDGLGLSQRRRRARSPPAHGAQVAIRVAHPGRPGPPRGPAAPGEPGPRRGVVAWDSWGAVAARLEGDTEGRMMELGQVVGLAKVDDGRMVPGLEK